MTPRKRERLRVVAADSGSEKRNDEENDGKKDGV